MTVGAGSNDEAQRRQKAFASPPRSSFRPLQRSVIRHPTPITSIMAGFFRVCPVPLEFA
jgi:hypothetical protein